MSINGFLRTSEYTFSMPEKTETPIISFVGLMADIKKGNIRIPDFQREYIWTPDQVLELLDSVWNGYPIGSILLWKTTQKLNEHDPLRLRHPELPKNSERLYLLDGQQRLVTLFEVIHDTLELGKRRKTKYRAFFDLKNKKFEIYPKKDLEGGKEVKPKIEDSFLPLEKVMIVDYSTRSARQSNELIAKFATNAELLQNYVDLFIRFNSLEFPAITNGQSLPIATKIFERLNNTGTPLTIVDLMVATTYTTNFNLRNKLREFISELDSKDFAISDRIILQCMTACLKKSTERDEIIDSSPEIESKWKKTTESLKLSIDFLNKHCSVPVSRFLPYEIMLAPLTYFFYHHGNTRLQESDIRQLQRYFWFNVLSDRYSSSQNTQVVDDIKRMDKLLAETKEDIFNYDLQVIINKPDIIKEIDMSFSSPYAKAVLCVLALKAPREFLNNDSVDLKRTFSDANLKQLHHVFPENVVKKMTDNDKLYWNSIANISLISRATNREIWDKKPSVYFGEFENDNLEIALESHFIGDLTKFGIKKDNFIKFLDERSKLISAEMTQLINKLN